MEKRETGRRGRGRSRGAEALAFNAAYTRMANPFAPQAAYSDDQIAAIHEGALRILEELGIRVLLGSFAGEGEILR